MLQKIRQLRSISVGYWQKNEKWLSLEIFASGIISVLFFVNGFDYIRWVLIYLLTLWVLIFTTIFLAPRLFRSRNGWQTKVNSVLEFIMQNMFEEVLIFLIPYYYFATTFDSPNVVFLLALIGAGISANVDAVYKIVHLRFPLLRYLYYGFCVFTCLNFVLPVLFGVRNIFSLYVSSAISLLLIIPMYFRFSALLNRKFLTGIGITLLMIWAVLTWGRACIPPAPLKLVDGRVSLKYNAVKLVPEKTFTTLPQDSLKAGVYCHTAIFAPMGLKENLLHVWRRNNAVVDRIALPHINGGRDEGYRTHSFKRHFPSDAVGDWEVDIVTAGGQLIGRTRFRITP